MASSHHFLNNGDSATFTTRPVGLTTLLFNIPSSRDPDAFQPTIVWHKILCCEPDHTTSAVQIDISAAGALVTVTNVSEFQAEVWTDWI